MSSHSNLPHPDLRFVLLASCLAIGLAISLAASHTLAENTERSLAQCQSRACVLVEHESALDDEAAALIEALKLRLARHGVHVELGTPPVEQHSPAKDGDPRTGQQKQMLLWIVHLRELSSEHVLLAIDSYSTETTDDLVRALERGPSPESTAWTLALIIEETVLQYVKTKTNPAPLGAGLALIEPPVVGGTKHDDEVGERRGPKLRLVSLALGVYRLNQADEFIAGPKTSVEGALTENLAASIGIGWVGWAEFDRHGIDGSTSLIPIDVMIGFLFLPEQVVELTLSAGFSVGFSIFRASRGSRHVTEVLFDPLGQIVFRAAFRLIGPLALYVDGGAAFVFVRDVLRDAGVTIYQQDWVMPFFNCGIQFWFV